MDVDEDEEEEDNQKGKQNKHKQDNFFSFEEMNKFANDVKEIL
jgi:hypothetical protein